MDTSVASTNPKDVLDREAQIGLRRPNYLDRDEMLLYLDNIKRHYLKKYSSCENMKYIEGLVYIAAERTNECINGEYIINPLFICDKNGIDSHDIFHTDHDFVSPILIRDSDHAAPFILIKKKMIRCIVSLCLILHTMNFLCMI